jgi:serine/threonine protein kinase/Tol biopolymer transport system component
MNDNPSDPAVIRDQLSRLKAGAAFRDSERHRHLLEFLVESTLRGEAGNLKEFVIAAEVWGRDVSFDPRIHSTVRVEIGRLRARLERHYAGEGSRDSIRFRIPTGSYGVIFQPTSPAAAVPVSGNDSHFEIVELIGRGGMGEVWKARDRRLGRDVALKFISRDLARNRAARERFEREARAAAALNHPNICTVYDVGESDGQPFLAMELLEGETLEQRLASREENKRLDDEGKGDEGKGDSKREGKGEVSVASLVEWGIEIADALEAAHSRGIVHSDLKPANLFLTNRGQTKILDFGLARLVGDSDASVRTKPKLGPVGTFGYMSPEQAKGEELDPRSDIYSLGIVLYRVATGRLPEAASGPPSSHNPLVPPDLDRIIGKALEGDREVRYQHASEMRADLKRLKRDSDGGLHRQPAARVSTVHGRRLGIGIACVACLAMSAAAVFWHFRASDRVPFGEFTVTRMTDTEDVLLTAISPDGKYLATVRKDAQGKQSLWVHHLPSNTDRRLLEGKDLTYNSIRLSPDSSFIYLRVVAEGEQGPHDAYRSDLYRVPVIGGDPMIIVRNVDSQISFIGDGQRLCFYRGDTDHKIYSFISASADGGDEKLLGTAPDLPSANACSPDGKRVALSFHSDEIVVIDFASRRSRTLYRPDSDRWLVYGINWTPDGKGMVISTADKGKFLLQLGYVAYPSGKFHQITNNLNTYLHGVSMTADGKTLAATEGRQESTFYLAPLSDPAKLHEAPFKWIDTFAWINDRQLVAAGGDSVLKLVDLKTPESKTVRVPKGYFFGESSKCGESSIVAEGGSQENPNQGIFRLSLDTGNLEQLTHGKRDLAPQCTPDGKWMLYVDNQDMRAPRLMAMPLAGGAEVEVAAQCTWFGLSTDGRLVAVEAHDGGRHIGLVTVGTWQHTKRIELPPGLKRSVNFDPNNRSVLLVGYTNGAGSIWRQTLDGAAPRQLFSIAGKQIRELKVSPDGSQIAFTAYASPADAVIFSDKSR